MSPAHDSLAAGRWQTLTLVEQLANVGSEVERAIRATIEGRVQRAAGAIDRALELFDLTANDPRWRGARCREILRVRELFCSLFFADGMNAEDAAFLRKYFLQFAVAARR